MLDSRCHSVLCVDGTDDCRPLPCTLTIFDTCGLEIRNDREVLPYLACKTGLLELLAKNRVGLAESGKTVTCDRAYAADTKTRARERLTIDHVVRQTELMTYDADFILEEQLDRLNELELDLFRKTADIVMRLRYSQALQPPHRKLR